MKSKVLGLTILASVVVATANAEQFKSFEIVSADAALAKVVFSRNYPPVLEVILRHRKARQLTQVRQ
jgi:hypothetical protein